MEIEDTSKKDEHIFGDVSFSDVLKDIYDNSTKKRRQIDILINELRPLIKQISDAALIVPLIKEYMEVAVKNDEQLVKMAAVYQKFIASETRAEMDSNAGGSMILTDEEKDQLMQSVTEESKKIIEDKKQNDVELSELIKKMDALKLESVPKEAEKIHGAQ